MNIQLLRFSSRLAAAGFAAIVLASSSCTSTPEGPLICPDVALVPDAMTVTRFSPDRGEDLTDIDYAAELTNVDSQCTFVGGRDQDQTVVVSLSPAITAIRGPANVDRKATVDYLVSVTDENRNILTVQRFPVSVNFIGNRNRVTVTDNDPPVTVAIPLTPGTSAENYQIFVAFQLAPQELDYNRRSQDRRP
jgi:hypothetical protein